MNVLNTIRSWIGLIFPLFGTAADFRHWPRWVWRAIHVLILIGVLTGLYFLNHWLGVENWLLLRNAAIRPFYLPIVFLLLYALSWLGYWLYRLLGEEDAAAEFPDVDEAWREAVAKLQAQGIGLADAPLYLILGRPAASEDALFQASEMQIAVRAPTVADAPLRVYAHRDAIFVTCAGASAWGRFAALLAGEEEAAVLPGAAATSDKTIQFGSEAMGISQESIDELRELLAKQQQRDLTAAERARLQELAELTKGPAQPKRRASLSPDAQMRGTERLRFLCKLIRRDRRPWCPVNGMLVLVPWAATESDDAAKESATMLQRDLAAARDALQLRYPTFALVCDLEAARGFAEFRRSFTPETLKKGRIGQRLPLVPDVAPAEVPGLLERGVQWIGQTVLPAGIVKFLRTDAPPGDPRATTTTAAATGHNRNLYMLLNQVYQRGPRLARVLSRGLPGGSGQDAADPMDALPLFGGCYLAGTGRTPQEQAFVPAVLQRLTEGQSSVSWTVAAIAEDNRYRRWTMYGYMGMAAILVAGIALGFLYGKALHGPDTPKQRANATRGL